MDQINMCNYCSQIEKIDIVTEERLLVAYREFNEQQVLLKGFEPDLLLKALVSGDECFSS